MRGFLKLTYKEFSKPICNPLFITVKTFQAVHWNVDKTREYHVKWDKAEGEGQPCLHDGLIICDIQNDNTRRGTASSIDKPFGLDHNSQVSKQFWEERD